MRSLADASNWQPAERCIEPRTVQAAPAAMWLTSAHVIGRVALIGLAAGLQLRADEPNDFGLSALDWEGLEAMFILTPSQNGSSSNF